MSYNQIHFGPGTAGNEIQRQKLLKGHALYTNNIYLGGTGDLNKLNRYEKYYIDNVLIPGMLPNINPNTGLPNDVADVYLEIIGRSCVFEIKPNNKGFAGKYGTYRSLIPDFGAAQSIVIPFATFGTAIEDALVASIANDSIITTTLLYEFFSNPEAVKPYGVILDQNARAVILTKFDTDPNILWDTSDQIFSIQVVWQR